MATPNKFNDRQVNVIRAAWKYGMSTVTLGGVFGIGPTSIQRIVSGRTYQGVPWGDGVQAATREGVISYRTQRRILFDRQWIGEPNSGCWLWTGRLGTDGYGAFLIGKIGMNAHRAAWLLYKGEIPDGLLVLHRHPERLCCNPDHLYLGTPWENVQDTIRDGNQPCGGDVLI